MRGKENACVTDDGNNGITPAYAGKSGSLIGLILIR